MSYRVPVSTEESDNLGKSQAPGREHKCTQHMSYTQKQTIVQGVRGQLENANVGRQHPAVFTHIQCISATACMDQASSPHLGLQPGN